MLVLICIVFSMTSISAQENECPKNYISWGASCYHFVESQNTWGAARNICKTVPGSDLAAIETAEEQDYLVKLISDSPYLSSYHYWLGGTDIKSPGTWVWVSTSQQFDYTNWAAGEPNNANENCAQLSIWPGHKGYPWNDSLCDISKFRAICEINDL
nr:perlucin-like protein [Terebratalia transversa]